MKERSISTIGSTLPVKLTAKKKIFCEEYLLDFCGAAAAVRAGYSAATAAEQASRLLANVDVRTYLDGLLAEMSRRTGVNCERVLRELARISFANPARVVGEDGSLLETATDDDLAAIQSIKVKQTPTKNGIQVEREVRFHDKNKSLELLGKNLGIFVDRKQIDVTSRIAEMTADERKKRIKELTAKAAIDIDCEPGDD